MYKPAVTAILFWQLTSSVFAQAESVPEVIENSRVSNNILTADTVAYDGSESTAVPSQISSKTLDILKQPIVATASQTAENDLPKLQEKKEDSEENSESKPPVFTEPFTELDLSDLKGSLEELQKLYTYNSHTYDFGLSLNKLISGQNFLKRGSHHIMTVYRSLPFKILSAEAAFLKTLLIGERLKSELIVRAEEILSAQNQHNSKEASLKLFQELKLHFEKGDMAAEIIKATAINSSSVLSELSSKVSSYYSLTKTAKITKKFDIEFLQNIFKLNELIINLSSKYSIHSSYCKAHIAYLPIPESRIKKLLALKNIKGSMEYLKKDIGKTETSLLLTIKTISALLEEKRNELKALMSKQGIKDQQVKSLLNQMSEEYHLKIEELESYNYFNKIKSIFSIYKEIKNSKLFENSLASQEESLAAKEIRDTRTSALLDELKPYLDPGSIQLTPDHGSVFEEKKPQTEPEKEAVKENTDENQQSKVPAEPANLPEGFEEVQEEISEQSVGDNIKSGSDTSKDSELESSVEKAMENIARRTEEIRKKQQVNK